MPEAVVAGLINPDAATATNAGLSYECAACGRAAPLYRARFTGCGDDAMGEFTSA